ncbi:hypothetical protein ACQPXM_27195 [Kribbella sp. CA-253562]|uniref:hypothetical protein n=1 Tax=Kribbella sp. CA-253562 TaxID=3239942 RepID=UPI003D94165B
MKLNKSLVVAAAAMLLGNIAALAVGAPRWVLALGTPAVLLLVALVVNRRRGMSPVPSSPFEEQTELNNETGSPPVIMSTLLRGIRLPSASPDYNYLFSAKVQWVSLGPDSADDVRTGLAVETLLRRARKAAADCVPATQAPAEHLTALLTYPETDDKHQVKVWATDIHVAVPSEVTDELRRLQQLRREQETIDREYELRRDRSRFFRNEVLASPGSATAWWLAAHPEELERCAELYPTFSRLSAMANDRLESSRPADDRSNVSWMTGSLDSEPNSHPAFGHARQADPPVHRVTDLESAVAFLLDGHTPSEKALKASCLAALEAKFKRPERAEQILDHFGAEPASSLTAPNIEPTPETRSGPQPSGANPDATTPLNSEAAPEEDAGHQAAAVTQPPEPASESQLSQGALQPEPEAQSQSPAHIEPRALLHAQRNLVRQPASDSDEPPRDEQPSEAQLTDGEKTTAAPMTNRPASQTPVSTPTVTEYREYFSD